MLCLSRSDVKGIVSLADAMAITEDAYRAHARGGVVLLSPSELTTPQRALRFSGGALVDSATFGMRLTLYGAETASAVLYDLESGELVCLMAYPMAELRTAALAGIVLRRLADPNARRLAMIGTGRNAYGYVRAACHLRPVEEVRVYSRDPAHRARFAEVMQAELGRPIVASERQEEALAGADVVFVSTSSSTPVVGATDLAAASLVVSMGRAHELDASVYLTADTVVVSHYPERCVDPPLDLVQAGKLRLGGEVEELARTLVGGEHRFVPGRSVVFRDLQSGFGDVVLAREAYQRCLEMGRGTKVMLH